MRRCVERSRPIVRRSLPPPPTPMSLHSSHDSSFSIRGRSPTPLGTLLPPPAMARRGGDESKEKRKPAPAPLGAAGIGVGKKMLVGFVWSCADMKLLLCSLLLLFAVFSLAPVLPPLSGFFPTSDLRACLSRVSSSPLLAAAGDLSSEYSLSSARSPPTTTENYHPVKEDAVEVVAAGPNGASAAVVRRAFNPVGAAAYLFIQMGAYRGGPNTFAVVGLASKPLHVFAKPTFQCEWIPHGNGSAAAVAPGRKILPDWGYGRVYTVVVVNCTFEEDVGADGSGGRLVLTAAAAGSGKGRGRSARQLSWLCLLWVHHSASVLAGLPSRVVGLLLTANRRISASPSDQPSHQPQDWSSTRRSRRPSSFRPSRLLGV